MLAVAGALKSAAPIEALAVGLDAVSELFADHRDFARSRQAVMRESLDELKAVTAGRQ